MCEAGTEASWQHPTASWHSQQQWQQQQQQRLSGQSGTVFGFLFSLPPLFLSLFFPRRPRTGKGSTPQRVPALFCVCVCAGWFWAQSWAEQPSLGSVASSLVKQPSQSTAVVPTCLGSGGVACVMRILAEWPCQGVLPGAAAWHPEGATCLCVCDTRLRRRRAGCKETSRTCLVMPGSLVGWLGGACAMVARAGLCVCLMACAAALSVLCFSLSS